MSMCEALRQMPERSGRVPLADGEAGRASASDEATRPRHETGSTGSALLMAALTRENLQQAWKRVRANKGAAGVDGRDIPETACYLRTAWPVIRDQLLQGTYRPSPVRRVTIPKPDGGERELGIPTVTDRLIQQALLQVLQPLLDPTFSENSFGFRPGRSAQEAVVRAQAYVQSGRRIVVDVDLEKFFDRVNHDILMDRLAKRIADKTVLRLIRSYLQAGIMANGVVMDRSEGTPQGGPLSPLLANVLLDEVDQDLQRRGHRFARYADDCNVYVRSQKAGERVLLSLRKLYDKLHLKVNEKKTEVGPVFGRKFLGYCLRRWTKDTVKISVAPKALDTCKQRIRLITSRVGGKGMAQIAEQMQAYLPGWKSYFRLAQTPQIFKNLDSWTRHRLRAIQLKHWRVGTTVYSRLRALGATHELAAQIAGGAGHWWGHSEAGLNRVLTVKYFDELGIPRLT